MVKGIAGFFSGLFEKDLMVKIVSFVAAVIIWFAVSISVYPEMSKTIYDVPIEVTTAGTSAETNNLAVITKQKETVTVTVTGNRGQIGNLTNADISAVAYTDQIRVAGTYTLPLTIESITGKEFLVTSFAEPSVMVELDELVTKEFPVSPAHYNDDIKTAAHFSVNIDDISVYPETVVVTGPKKTIDKVKAALIRVSVEETLSESYDYVSSELMLMGANNSQIRELEQFTFSVEQFNIHIPVMLRQTFELVVRITNAPSSFNVNAFSEQLIFSDNFFEVSAPSEYIKEINRIEIGEIDMRLVEIGEVFTFYTEDFLPNGYQSDAGIEMITVTCPSDGLSKIDLFIQGRNVKFINTNPNYDYTLVSSGFAMTFMGPADIIAAIDESDIKAEIDLLGNTYEVSEGDYKLNVEFSVTGFDSVWCISSDGSPSPKATVKVTSIDG